MSKSLIRVLSYDVAILTAIVLYFWLDAKRLGFVGMLLPLGFVWLSLAGRKLQKNHVATLTRREKKIRFGVSSAGFIVLLGFVVSWAFRSGTGVAWAFASLAIIVLAALYYAEWDRLNDELKQAPQNEAQEKMG